MKTFDQLTQDHQMLAVEQVIDDMVSTTLNGILPACFLPFISEIDQTLSAAFLSKEAMLRQLIEQRKDIKIAMLHQAGRTAKRTVYLEDGDLTVRL